MAKLPYCEETATGLLLRIYLTPRAQKDRIGEIYIDADGQAYLKVYVRAVPEDNKANQALIALLAKTFGVAKSQLSLVSGHQSRKKKVSIEGKKLVIPAKV